MIIVVLAGVTASASHGGSFRLTMTCAMLLLFGLPAILVYRGGAATEPLPTRTASYQRDVRAFLPIGLLMIGLGAALQLTSAWELGVVLLSFGGLTAAGGQAHRKSVRQGTTGRRANHRQR